MSQVSPPSSDRTIHRWSHTYILAALSVCLTHLHTLIHSLLLFLKHVIFPSTVSGQHVETLEGRYFRGRPYRARGTDNTGGRQGYLAVTSVRSWVIQVVHRVHSHREMCYAAYYSFVPFLISVFFCCRSLISPGMHLALPCQQCPIWCAATVARASMCMHMYIQRCAETQHRTHKTNTQRSVWAKGKGGNYSGGPKLEVEPQKNRMN